MLYIIGATTSEGKMGDGHGIRFTNLESIYKKKDKRCYLGEKDFEPPPKEIASQV